MVEFLVVEDQEPVMKNVANVIMLPIPMLSIVNLSRRPYWELATEIGDINPKFGSWVVLFFNAETQYIFASPREIEY